MRCIHAVLICPQLGTGIFTVSESVDNRLVNGQRISSVVIVTDFNSRFAGSTIAAVVESAVVHNKICRLCCSSLSIKQDRLAVRVECAALKCHIRAAPCPDGILVGHCVFKFAVDECSLAVQSQLALDSAVLVCQLVADDAVEAAFARLNGKVLKCK